MKKLLFISLLLVACSNGQDGSISEVTTIPATSCTVVQTVTNTTITCPDGTYATIPNTSIVQFCPGTPSYPLVFPEVGFCIDNQIYAVYSIPDAFMTLVTPGYYTSNGIGSSCNFYVNNNCQISY